METIQSKLFVLMLFIAFALTAKSQVTIGSNTVPNASAVLDLQSNDKLGLLLPRVVLTDTLLSSPLAEHVKGMFVYNTESSGDGKVKEGVYMNDGRRWWSLDPSIAEPWMISGTEIPASSNKQNIYQMGNVSIGAATSDSAAVLNVYADDKGVLLPHVTLTGPTDQTTIPNPPVGLIVYSTGTDPNFTTTGYLYWNGWEWTLFDGTTSTSANITNLNCDGAFLSPAQYIQGQYYDGMIKIPYSGGNGGAYSSSSSFISHGLTFTLQGGRLEAGSGELIIHVQGTPDISSPESVTILINGEEGSGIEIPFYDVSCSIKVGDQITADIHTIAVMNYMQFMTDADTGAKGFGVYCTTPDGLYTVRVWFLHSRQNAQATANNNTESIVSAYNNVQLRNNSDETKTLMWNYEIAYGGHISNAGGNLQVPPKVFGGAESGNSWVSNSPTTNARWGDPGIYNAVNSGPEYRRYSWIDTSTTTKVAYTVSVMAGMDPQAVNTDISKQKVFIKIEQITAM